jgi:hypothetical protein
VSSFVEHGCLFGVILGWLAYWLGLPVWAFFALGFFDGSRADWLGDYVINHLGRGFWPYSPGNWLHWAVFDPIVHKYNPQWWDACPWYIRAFVLFLDLAIIGGVVGLALV